MTKRLQSNQLHISKSYCKTLFLFYFYLSQTRSFVYDFRPRGFFTVFFKRKAVHSNGHFSNGIHYQVGHQPSVSQLYIHVTLCHLLL